MSARATSRAGRSRPREMIKELAAEDMKRLAVRREPFYAGGRLPWMRPDYREC